MSHKKTLVVDAAFRPIAFISFKRLIRMEANDKIEPIEFWDGEYPAIVRLKEYLRNKPIPPRFTFRRVIQRDRGICQYTGDLLTQSTISVDHVVPKSHGGESSFTNCVCADLTFNRVKGNRTPEQMGAKLLRKPFVPKDIVHLIYPEIEEKHPAWEEYFLDY
jgi:5-methylcytosine-specific restriction endonuclease McrA